MQLVTKVKLLPSEAQAQRLAETLEGVNVACNRLSEMAWQAQQFGRWAIHALGYYAIREEYGLSAQAAVRCVAKVADSYHNQQQREAQHKFKPHGSIAYDARLLTWQQERRTMSIWALGGRLQVAYMGADWQHATLARQKGESGLLYQDGTFYLAATCEVPEPQTEPVEDILGIDLGLVNLATDSDGEMHAGGHLNHLQYRHARLQKKGTKSAKRLLRKRRRKERRFARQVNHVLSKQVVQKVQRTQRGIALEDLRGIRARIRAKKPRRRHLHSWAFRDLRQKISYKARLAGVPVWLVSPRHTSQACSSCGHIDRRNRPTQDAFRCTRRGYAAHADVNAAVNVGRRAAQTLTSPVGGVNQPNAAAPLPGGQLQATGSAGGS